MKKPHLFLSLLLLASMLNAQKPSEENRKKLLELAVRLDSAYRLEQQKIKEYLEVTQGAQADIPPNGEPSGFSPTGRLLYTIDHNEIASRATRTTDLYPGGRLATSITGKGMVLGVWEISSPDPFHSEFQGRLIIRDGATEVGDHATHVSGTLIAGGVGAEVRGMAYEAVLHAYSASGYLSEIAIAAADGLLVSSHSYGKSAGWSGDDWLGDPNVSDEEDWKFGIYNEEAASLDEIAFLAPHYLLVRSAGNERGEGGSNIYPPDGPYDTMTGEANAKNILAIGNAIVKTDVPNHRSQLLLRASSSWGPTDDGRIKPDLVAPGTDILSSSIHDGGYGTKTGTSMSTPVVAGNAILLQQHHQRLYQYFMKSATLKGLLLHTTFDAGEEEGPDFEYGYGFLDANFAARTISEKGTLTIMEERSLSSQATFETQFEVTDINSPLIVSISWTDPAGEPTTRAQLDPDDIKLVNDLDVRVEGPDGGIIEPWILDHLQPEQAATTGDNFKDNYEKIEIVNPALGEYTISVSHKGELLNGVQDYSLIVSNLARVDHKETYYWTGEDGDWEDPSKWSKTSGGSSAGVIPTSTDRVIFDNNSFGNDKTVTINGNVTVSQMAWFVDNRSKLNFNDHVVDVSNTIHIDGMMVDEISTVAFKPSSLTGSIFISGENDGLIIQAQKENKDFFISGEDMVVNGIDLQNGNVSFLNNFSAENLTFSSLNESQVNFDGIEITTSKLNLGDVSLIDVSTEDAVFIFDDSDGQHEISSNGFFEIEEALVNSGTFRIVNNGKIDKLSMGSGTTFSLDDEAQLEVDDLSIEGTDDHRSLITTAGNGSILSNSSSKFCFDFVDIDGVDVSGSTNFVYESNSSLTDANGWLSAQCEDVLFADFTFRSACAKNTTYFTSAEDGSPETWTWDFGDGGTSTDKNPVHSFQEPGTFIVTLTTTSGIETSTFSKEVEIIESLLSIPVIIFQGGRLSTEAPGPFFQWYLDGEPIEGETSRLLSTEIGDGVYHVEAFNANCSALSDPFVPLGTDDVSGNFDVYPNPAKEVMFLSFARTGKVEVEIVDLGGKVMDRLMIESASSKMPIAIPVQSYDPGIYLLRVNSKNSFITKKIIIGK